MRYELIVIGTDPAGLIAAKAAAMRNLRTAFVLPELSLENLEELSVAIRTLVPVLSRQHMVDGVPYAPETGGVFDLQSLRTELTHVMEQRRQRIVRELNCLGVDVIPGNARFERDHSLHVEHNGRSAEFTAERIVIATGTKLRQPGFVDFTQPGIVDLCQLLDGSTIPTSLTIVGGNRIALETGMLFAAVGTDVTIVNGNEFTLNDEALIDQLFGRAMDLGIKFLSQSRAIGVDTVEIDRRHVTRAYLDNGMQVCGDVTLWCDKRIGCTDELDIFKADVSPDESGRLWCDDAMKTWNPKIAAVGSVVGFSQCNVSLVDAAEMIVDEILNPSAVPHPKVLRRKGAISKQETHG